MKYLLLSTILISTLSNADIITLSPGQTVKAAEINANFNYFNSILSLKEQETINFTSFSSGQPIKKELLELEFDKLRNIGVSISALTSSNIKAIDFNDRFDFIKSQINEFNNPPIIGNIHFEVAQNLNFSGNFNYQDLDNGSVSTTLLSPASKGTVTILPEGEFTFTPATNTLGSDSFTISYSDGESTKTQVISINIDGSGIIQSSSVRFYYDNTYASSCESYRNTNIGKYTYTGITGNGTYRIKPDEGSPFDVVCDMTTNGGGWTLVSNANQVSNIYNTTTPQLTTTQNFNILSRFPNWENTSKLVKVNNSLLIGQFTKSVVATWTNGAMSLTGGGTKNLRYSNRADSVWMVSGIPYSSLAPTIGGFCNTVNNLIIYMNNKNDGNVAIEGGVHPGVQASQGGCDDGATWRTNFSWQVYTK